MKKPKVLLIGWDGADWEHIDPLLEQGLLPHLEQLINEGVMGNLATLQPMLSPMLWNSVVTGKHAYRHGILGFIEPDPHTGGSRPFSSYSRSTRALWNIFTLKGIRSNVINWWASHPAERINGCVVTNLMNGVKHDAAKGFVGAKGMIHPADKTDFYSQFKVFPNELTSEHLCPFIPRAAEIDQDQDSRLESLAKVIAETATTQAVATAVMETEPWDFMAAYFTGIDHFSHAFMVYHPPRMPHVPEKDFEIFKEVITGAYRFHDMILARLLQLAGPETTVILCSDHGFQSGNLRPVSMPREPAGPAIWHRRFGIFVAKGPGIRQDERVYGASLIDIAPTILALYGLPVGQDMDGRVLKEIFETEPEISTIPSWDDVDGDCGMHGAEEELDPAEAEELLKQFVALGYIDDPGADKKSQKESAEIETNYNLARNYRSLNMNDEAIPLLDEIVQRRPWENRFIVELVEAYQGAGYLRHALQLLEAAFDIQRSREPIVKFNWAQLRVRLGDFEEALEALHDAEKLSAHQPGLLNRIGQLYLRCRQWESAERVLKRAIRIHPENADAYLGLSSIYRHQKLDQETADAALTALGLIYRLPQAHFNLGVALTRAGDHRKAITAFTTALKFGPRMQMAHRWLALIHRKFLHDDAQADFHVRESRRIQQQLSAEHKDFSARRQLLFPLPEFPKEAERIAKIREERPNREDPRRSSGKTFVLVSGLPRSGTSLMMQMLEAGGLPPKTDGVRVADEDNPKGYYEWEAIKSVVRNPKILDEDGLQQRAIKVVSPLLQQLPYSHQYLVIFMTRPIDEVVQSQAAMIDRLESSGGNLTDEKMAAELEQHRNQTLRWLEHHPRISHVEIDFPELLANPDDAIARVVELLGAERLPQADAMKAVIDQDLYRRRSKTPASK